MEGTIIRRSIEADELITERRYAECRLSKDGAMVEGIAMRYGDIAMIGGMFRERFEPRSLEFDDVTLNVMHDRSLPLANTKGGTLTLNDSPSQLEVRAQPVLTQHAADAMAMLKNSLLSGFSLEFRALEETYERDLRIVHRAKLVGIGLVDKPAYGDSVAAVAKRMQLHNNPQPRWYRWL